MNAPLSRAEPADDAHRALISALVDGDADSSQRACDAWRNDSGARAAWHEYHLIGDVLRSEDLAAAPRREAALLAAVRARLADEPVLLLPVPRRQRWLVPAAAAAGFVAVAGVMVVARLSSPAVDGPLVASTRAPTPFVLVSGTTPAVESHLAAVTVIRNPDLDRYLQAHRAALGSVALPGGAPRSIETLAPITPAVAPVSR